MKRVILGVAAALLLTAGQASAEGLSHGSRIASEPINPKWTGFYLGVGVGAGAMVTDTSLNGCKRIGCNEWQPVELFGFDGIGAEGVFGTVSIGYDLQIRRKWVVGVFADYDFGSSISTEANALTFIGPVSASIDQNYTWSVGGRLGYLVNPSTLVYGTAGYTETELEASIDTHYSSGSASDTFGGYFVGAGLETMLRPNWSLKLEYRFSQFDEAQYGEDCFNLTVEPSEHTARLVLSYKFGGHDHGGSIKD